MRIYGSKGLVIDVAQRDLCIGCGMCVNICPYFKTYKGKSAMLFPCTLEQGRCNAHCPKTEVDLDALSRFFWNETYDGALLGRFKRIVAARAGDKVSGGFQGGGTVSALIAYALKRKMIEGAVLTGAEGIEPVARLVTDPEEVAARAGSKFIAAPTPAALKRFVETGGLSTLKGVKQLVSDFSEYFGMPSSVDKSAFKVGENLANTAGAVIYRNDVIELIQYKPTTEKVFSRPILIIPPQIKKFYVFDLSENNSIVKYMLSKGLQVFTVSWKNATPKQRHWNLTTYINALEEAIAVIANIAGSKDVNAMAACSGGAHICESVGLCCRQ